MITRQIRKQTTTQITKFKYPTTLYAFLEWCNSNETYREIYKNLGKPRPYDVSLRDGLQGLTKEQQESYTILKKIEVYKEIMNKHCPKSIEFGSIVSKTIFPVFKDTLELYKFIQQNNFNNSYQNIDNYVFIPNYNKFCEAVKNDCYYNLSFVSSASEQFLLKNINQDFTKNYEELSQIVYSLDNLYSNKSQYKTKLYLSCVNECPIVGKMDNMKVVEKILQIKNLNFDMICLSDTCGTLEPRDFEFIVDKCNELGMPYNNFGLHLHVNPIRETSVEKIIHKALERKIVDFDVSILDTGGCSVTIDREKLTPNLSYELYYKALVNYIIDKSK